MNGNLFVSELDRMFDVEEYSFECPQAFGRYRKFFPDEAVAHPAKFYVDVIEFIIKKYTKEGDVLLDPMAGTYSLCVVGALLNRNCIGVDIEERFYRWGLEAKRRVEAHESLTPKGKMIVLQGDARELSKILNNEIDMIITSPPYAESINKHAGGPVGVRNVGISTKTARAYSWDDANIGNLRYGNVDAIITSPPYAESLSTKSGGIAGKWNIDGTAERKKIPLPYSGDEKNIGNLKWKDEDLDETIRRLRSYGRSDPKAGGPYGRSLGHPYSPSEKNIGNLKEESYLDAMLRVYRECYKVLKPDGLIIVVVKPFIRRKKVVDLPYHTYLLLGRAGFKPVEVWKYRLRHLSFWRLLYYKKHEGVPFIGHEYVIVCRK